VYLNCNLTLLPGFGLIARKKRAQNAGQIVNYYLNTLRAKVYNFKTTKTNKTKELRSEDK
jgi:hypothetical protein